MRCDHWGIVLREEAFYFVESTGEAEYYYLIAGENYGVAGNEHSYTISDGTGDSHVARKVEVAHAPFCDFRACPGFD